MASRQYFTRRFTPYTYASESLAYFAAYLASVGSPLSKDAKDIIDEFIVGLKTDKSLNPAITSQWSEMALIRSYMNQDRIGATMDMVNPSFALATEVSSPIWTPQFGFTFNGLSSYLNQNWNSTANGGTKYTANSCGITIVSLTEVITVNPKLGLGEHDGGFNGVAVQLRNGTNQGTLWCQTPYPTQIVNPTSIGTFTVNKTGSGTLDIYRDGVLLSHLTGQGDTALSSRNHYTGCANNNGTAAGFCAHTFALEMKHSGYIDAGKLYDRIDTFISKFRSL